MTSRAPVLLLVSLLPAACGDPVAHGTLSVDMAIESVTPSELPTRGGVEVTVLGRNFPAGLKVTVGGKEPLGLVRHSDTKITFVAPALPFGAEPLVITGPALQTVSWEPRLRYVVERVALANQTLISEQAVRGTPWAGRGIRSAALGDFDGDRDLDLAVLRGGVLMILANDQVGAPFRRVAEYPVDDPDDEQTVIVLAGDLDGDGPADLVTTSQQEPDWKLWTATGDGRLAPASTGFTPPPGRAVLGDFAPGGGLEIAVAGAGLWIFRASRDATVERLREVPDVSLAVSDGVVIPPVAQDLNKDGLTDLVYVDDTGLLHALMGPDLQPRQGWTSTSKMRISGSIARFAVGDVTEDGIADIAAPDLYGDLVIFAGTGDGRFAEPQTFDLSCMPEAILFAGSTTGEKDYPYTVAYCLSGTLFQQWYHGKPSPGAYPEGRQNTFSARFTDLDGDRLVDMVYVSPDGVAVRYGVYGENIRFSPHPALRPASALTRGNFGRGRPLAVAHKNLVSLVEQTGGGLRAIGPTDVGGSLDRLVACDIDGDTVDDVIGVRSEPDQIEELVVLRTAGAGFGAPVPIARAASPWPNETIATLLARDFTGDGRCDLFVVRRFWPLPTSPASWTEQLLINTGAGFSTADVTIPAVVPEALGSLAAGDVDGDGALDIFDRKARGVFRNDGTGRFSFEPLDMQIRGMPLLQQAVTDLVIVSHQDWAELWVVASDRLDSRRFRVGHAERRTPGGWGEMHAITGSSETPRVSLVIGDLNGDGRSDALLTPLEPRLQPEIFVSLGGVDGRPGRPTGLYLSDPNGQAARNDWWFGSLLLDYDGDGLDDLLFKSADSNGKIWMVHNDSE